MDARELGVLIPILVPLGAFVLTFGIIYLRNRERMSMIERGMDPRRFKQQSAPFLTLKWGLLLIGAGIGLFLAFLLDRTIFSKSEDDANAAIYFALIAIFGGLGLFLSFYMEKKDLDKNDGKIEE